MTSETSQCWSCSKPGAEFAPLCPHCGKVQPPPALRPGETRVVDKFAVLGIPRSYELDEARLEEAFRSLSRKLHPDRFARASAQERRFSLEQTTLLNDAYRSLKDPARRAEHLLELHGVRIAAEGGKDKRTMPPEFLEQALEDREKLLEAKAEGGQGAVEELAHGVRARRDATLAQVGAALRALEGGPARSPRALDEVADALLRLRYYARYLDEVEGKTPEP